VYIVSKMRFHSRSNSSFQSSVQFGSPSAAPPRRSSLSVSPAPSTTVTDSVCCTMLSACQNGCDSCYGVVSNRDNSCHSCCCVGRQRKRRYSLLGSGSMPTPEYVIKVQVDSEWCWYPPLPLSHPLSLSPSPSPSLSLSLPRSHPLTLSPSLSPSPLSEWHWDQCMKTSG
jgi:hypothetical protein